MRRLTVLLTLVVLLAGLLPASSLSFAADNPAPIRLKAGTFRPGLGEKPDIPPGLAVAEPAAAAYGYYLVQFAGPIQAEWKEALAGLGAEILAYVPDFAFKVRMTPAQANQARRLETVNWVGLFQPAYKLSPSLAREGTNQYTVRLERGADFGQATAAIARSGAQILSRQDGILVILAEAAQLDEIARVLDVAWIQNFAFQETHNEYGAGVIMGANQANANGYDGSTQTVAVADTGLGDGTAAGAHPDIPASRITAIYDLTRPDARNCYYVLGDGARDVDSGHGTHVSGSVLGDGQAGGVGLGTAPAAHLVFQATEEYLDFYRACQSNADGYYLIGIPDDIRDLFQQAYDAGARIHSDSWGHDAAGDYDLDAANTDSFVWTNPDMTILTSAGNAGIDQNGDGYVDVDSMGSPATAKNLITVGATENDRGGDYACDAALTYVNPSTGTSCASLGGANDIFTYGGAWPTDFPADPVASDVSAGNPEQMAAFSSRGPTDDGRIKPDVVAPGTWVLSTYAGLFQEGYDPTPNPQNGLWQYDGWGFPLDAAYKYMGGTSMSTPLTAGGAAVVRDYYEKAHGHDASAALVKATLINSAVDILDENNDGADDNDYPIPNNHEGWGRVDLAAATDGSHEFVEETVGLGTGGSTTYAYIVPGGGAFKVSLVWSDYPSTESAAQNLVNDLDLVVTAPGGTVYRGNVFANGWSQAGGSADRTNNVENVYVQSAAAGTWTVQVSGYNAPYGPQPYALVVDGGAGVVVNQPPVASFTYTCDGRACDFTSTSDDPDGTIVAWDWDFGDDTTGSGETPSHTYAVEDTYTVVLTVTDDEGAIDTDTQDVRLGQAATLHVGDLDGSSAQVNRNFWRATVTITVHDAAHNPLANALVSGAWSGGASGTGSCTTTSTGQCSINSAKLPNSTTSATFTVTDVGLAGYTYDPASNHDPDGDSDGTTITID